MNVGSKNTQSAHQNGYHHNGFVATHAFAHVMHSYILLVPMNQRVLYKPT